MVCMLFPHTLDFASMQKVAEKILNGAELEFYKWDGDIKELLAGVKAKLNKVAEVIFRPNNSSISIYVY